jgi:murein DD-endopeptidase MepM/ murein hydrolase activator NlpD
MTTLDLLYITDAHRRWTAVVYAVLVVSIVTTSASFLNFSHYRAYAITGLPVPGTYRAGLVARPMPQNTITASYTVGNTQVLAAGPSVWPLHGLVTTEFGASDLPYQRYHTGIDISSRQPSGVSIVQAFAAGTVFIPQRGYSGYGTMVAIDHGAGLTSYYGHLSGASVGPGQHVAAGQLVGREGSTGNSTGPHVHFEIRQNDQPVNPRRFLSGNP